MNIVVVAEDARWLSYTIPDPFYIINEELAGARHKANPGIAWQSVCCGHLKDVSGMVIRARVLRRPFSVLSSPL